MKNKRQYPLSSSLVNEAVRFVFVLFLLFVAAPAARGQEVLESFESLLGWMPAAQGDAVVAPSLVQGESGKCLKLEFSFGPAAGYAGIEKGMDILLPENFTISFQLRGDVLVDGFQMRLTNETEGTTWWWSKKDFTLPSQWTRIFVKKRQLRFAWGNNTQTGPHGITRIGFFILPRGGNRGALYLDDLTITGISKPADGIPAPSVFASSSAKGFEASKAADRNLATLWRSEGRQAQEHLFMDLRAVYDFGGMKIAWDSVLWAKEFSVSVSDDGKLWSEHYAVKNGNGLVSFIPLPEGEGRYLKVNMKTSAAKKGYAVKEIAILGNSFSASQNSMYEEIARTFPRGLFPIYFSSRDTSAFYSISESGHVVYFTSRGVVQPAASGFSLEPFFVKDGKILFPSTLMTPRTPMLYDGFSVLVKPLILQGEDVPYLKVDYQLRNTGSETINCNLYIAVRPFSAALDSARAGLTGTLPIASLSFDESRALINDAIGVYPLEKPAAFGAAEFDRGDIALYCRTDSLPAAKEVLDHMYLASGAFLYPVSLAPRAERTISFTMPYAGPGTPWEIGLPPAEKKEK